MGLSNWAKELRGAGQTRTEPSSALSKNVLSEKDFASCAESANPMKADVLPNESIQNTPIAKAYKELSLELKKRFKDESIAPPPEKYIRGDLVYAVTDGSLSTGISMGTNYGKGPSHTFSRGIQNKIGGTISEANQIYLKMVLLHESGHADAGASHFSIFRNGPRIDVQENIDIIKRKLPPNDSRINALDHIGSVFSESYADVYSVLYGRLLYGDKVAGAYVDALGKQRKSMPQVKLPSGADDRCDFTDRFKHHTGSVMDRAMALDLKEISSGEDISKFAKKEATDQMVKVMKEAGLSDFTRQMEGAVAAEANSCDSFLSSGTGLLGKLFGLRSLGNGVLMCGKDFKP